MRQILALFTLIFLQAGPAVRGDEASKQTKVEEFFRLTQLEQALSSTMEQTTQMVNSSVMQELSAVKLTAEQTKRLDELQRKAIALIAEAFGWENLKPHFVKLYAETYTDKELDDILAFYRSPSGQAMVTKGLTLIPKTNAFAQERLAKVQPELQRLIKEFTAGEKLP